MKLTNKVLIAVLAILVLFVLYTQFGNNNKGTFTKDLIELDTAKVTSLTIYPNNAPGKEMMFFRENNNWLLTSDTLSGQQAKPGIVSQLLATLANIKTKRLAATGKEKWAEYEVDANSRRVVVKNDNKVLLDLYIGKLNISQPQQPAGGDGGFNPNQMQRPTATSYIRLSNDDKVYAVDGALGASFSQEPEQYLVKPTSPTPLPTDTLNK